MTSKKPVDRKKASTAKATSAGKTTKSAASAKRTQPATFRARAISVSLTVKDLRASVAWYRDYVGFIVAREIEYAGQVRSVRMKAGTVEVLLNQDDGAKGWDRAKGEGMSIYFTTAQRVDDIANRIKQQGGRLETEPADTPWGVRMFRVKDPDGFRIAISSERSS